MEDLLRLKDKILEHDLGDKEEAFFLYETLCNLLKDKYGLVDKDYDKNPTRRGKEWLDIHHIMEYELDDIARRTQGARPCDRIQIKGNYMVAEFKVDNDFEEKKRKVQFSYKKEQINNPKLCLQIIGYANTIDELKPYNAKEKLVYANKIEHFLLHYLIDSIRGKDFMSGGPNYIWDAAVALDVYAFDMEYLSLIQKNKDEYYSYMDSTEITLLYKKLIDWKHWNIKECANYWLNYKNVFSRYKLEKLSYFTNIKKLKFLLQIIGIHLPKVMVEDIDKLPLKERLLTDKQGNIVKRIINNCIYEKDGTTLCRFGFPLYSSPRSLVVPKNATYIKNNAFDVLIICRDVEKIKIPQNVKIIEDHVFVRVSGNVIEKKYINLKQLIYSGSTEEWNEKFSNVILKDIELVCKK